MLAEEVRHRLGGNPCFNLKRAFEVLDFGGKGEISVSDIRRLIEERGFFISDNEASSLLDKFDNGSKRGTITQKQFIGELMPKSR